MKDGVVTTKQFLAGLLALIVAIGSIVGLSLQSGGPSPIEVLASTNPVDAASEPPKDSLETHLEEMDEESRQRTRNRVQWLSGNLTMAEWETANPYLYVHTNLPSPLPTPLDCASQDCSSANIWELEGTVEFIKPRREWFFYESQGAFFDPVRKVHELAGTYTVLLSGGQSFATSEVGDLRLTHRYEFTLRKLEDQKFWTIVDAIEKVRIVVPGADLQPIPGFEVDQRFPVVVSFQLYDTTICKTDWADPWIQWDNPVALLEIGNTFPCDRQDNPLVSWRDFEPRYLSYHWEDGGWVAGSYTNEVVRRLK